MKLDEVKEFLKFNITREFNAHYGCNDNNFIEEVTNNWHEDKKNYDGRWQVIDERAPQVVKVLDMAAGCGTFVLYGLHNGYDAWGVEPEQWKREYYRKKIEASGYCRAFIDHVIDAVGEDLPFEDNSFDLITTYQTLEHVQDINKCIREMLRVVKPGGVVYVRAPDYNSFFEPHYRIPFLPKMNRKLASVYLKCLGKPTAGLNHLYWTTEKEVLQCFQASGFNLRIERTGLYYYLKNKAKIREKLPWFLAATGLADLIWYAYNLKNKIVSLTKVGREENVIDLWVRKFHDHCRESDSRN